MKDCVRDSGCSVVVGGHSLVVEHWKHKVGTLGWQLPAFHSPLLCLKHLNSL